MPPESIEQRLSDLATSQVQLDGKVTAISKNMEEINVTLGQVAEALTTIAVQGEQVMALRRTVDQLTGDMKVLTDRQRELEVEVAQNTALRTWSFRLALGGAIAVVGFVWKKVTDGI